MTNDPTLSPPPPHIESRELAEKINPRFLVHLPHGPPQLATFPPTSYGGCMRLCLLRDFFRAFTLSLRGLMYPRSHHTTAIIVDQSHVRPTDRVATHFIAFLAFGAHSFNSESFVIRWLPGSDFPFLCALI